MEMEQVIKDIRKWIHDRNLQTATTQSQLVKLGEEFGELCAGIARDDDPIIEDSLGDMFVVMMVIAEIKGFEIDDCIKSAYEEIKDRKGKLVNGVFIKEEDLHNLEDLK